MTDLSLLAFLSGSLFATACFTAWVWWHEQQQHLLILAATKNAHRTGFAKGWEECTKQFEKTK